MEHESFTNVGLSEDSRLSFQRVLAGAHPDLKPVCGERATMAQQDLAIHLTLRDIFSPIAQELCQTANSITTQDTALAIQRFEFSSPFRQNYIHDWNELGLAVLSAKYGFNTTETLRKLYSKLKAKADEMRVLDGSDKRQLTDLDTYFSSEAFTTDYSSKYGSEMPETPELAAALAGLLRTNHINTDPKKLGSYTGDLDIEKFTAFMWLPTETEAGTISTINKETAAPIGDYGEAFTKKLLLSTKILMQSADLRLVEISRSTANQHQALLERATARGRDERGLVDPPRGERVKVKNEFPVETKTVLIDLDRILPEDENAPKDWSGEEIEVVFGSSNKAFEKSPLVTTIEGVEAITHTISLLMAEKIPGYDDPSVLLEAIIKKGFVGHLSIISPIGLVGPLNRGGNYVKQLLIVNEKGELALNPKVVKEIIRLKKVQTEMYRFKFSINRPDVVVTGYGCPVGRKSSNTEANGIQSISEALLHIFQSMPS